MQLFVISTIKMVP